MNMLEHSIHILHWLNFILFHRFQVMILYVQYTLADLSLEFQGN